MTTNDPVLFLSMAERYSAVCTYHIRSSDGDSGCVHVLATVTIAAMNIRLHASFGIMVFPGYR